MAVFRQEECEEVMGLMAKRIAKAIGDLVRAGYPESTARKIVSGELPMDEASRMSRAREMGYDVDKLFYHGTPEAQAIADMGFDPKRLGQGNDQMGAGFYFTDNPYQASGYAQGANAGIIPSLLRSSRSQEVDIDAPAGFGIELDENTAEQIMKRAPNIRDDDGPLSDFIEPSGMDGYTDEDIASVASMYVGRDADILLGDIFKYDADQFLNALTEATGIDSVVTRSARESDPTIRTVFDPSQVRSPNAAFDPDMARSGNIMASRPEAAIGGLLSASDFDEARAALDEEEGYQYYDILPIRKNLMGREQPYELALPNIIREPARALLNLSEQLETGERDPAKAMGLLF